MATLAEVAKRAGVAPSTVSFVLNGSFPISNETRQLVLQAAKELQYSLGKPGRPHRAPGAKPVPRRRRTVGFFYSFSESAFRTNVTYMTALNGAEVGARDAGQDLVVREIGTTPSSVNLAKLDGAVVVMTKPPEEYTYLLEKIPVVRIMGVQNPVWKRDHVSFNNAPVGTMAAEYLLARGHRHCAFFSPYAGHPQQGQIVFSSVNYLREKNFVEAIRASGAEVRVNSVGLPTDFYCQHEPLAEILRALLLPEPRPTALFVPADHFISHVYSMLYAIGVIPGEDIEVISCNNDTPVIQSLHPRPATIDLHIPTIGKAGIDTLLKRIAAPESPYITLLFEPTLIPASYAFKFKKV